MLHALTLIAQADPGAASRTTAEDSGIGAVTSEEWIVAGALVVVFVLASIAARKAVSAGFARAGTPAPVASLLGRFSGYLMIVVGFVYALATVDVRIGPLLGALGIGGIALAFALQEILSNLVSGVLLQLRRPFVAGDQIVSGDHEGIVEDVNLRVVRLRTFDGETVFIPNSQVLQNPITNWTATPTRRTTLNIGVAYEDDLQGAQRAIIAAVGSVPEIETEPAPEAFVFEFGDNSVNFAVRYWHHAPVIDMWRARDAVAQAIKRALDDAGYTMPFPQRTLWFGPGNTRLELRAPASDDAGG